jgi:hypothetical protein
VEERLGEFDLLFQGQDFSGNRVYVSQNEVVMHVAHPGDRTKRVQPAVRAASASATYRDHERMIEVQMPLKAASIRRRGAADTGNGPTRHAGRPGCHRWKASANGLCIRSSRGVIGSRATTRLVGGDDQNEASRFQLAQRRLRLFRTLNSSSVNGATWFSDRRALRSVRHLFR